MLSICAVIAVRNEAQYLPILLPILASQQIEVAVIDHGSTDGSRELCLAFQGNPVIRLDDLPYEGVYSQTQQLQAKQRIYNNIKHDWVLHHDADEIFEHFKPGLTLRDAIEEADDSGHTALNFDEFVFLPEPQKDYSQRNYYTEILRYYFFEPHKNRKNATWKRSAGLDNISSGGHILTGEQLHIFPRNHVHRHYIVLSYEHAIKKYLNRTFSSEDRKLGWHGNRLNFTRENLRLPYDSSYILRLDSYDSKAFNKEKPAPKHYWQWD